MSEEDQAEQADPAQENSYGPIMKYVNWISSGNIIYVAAKILWTGWWLTALLTFNFIETGVLLVVGILIWFIVNDYENWYIEV